MRSSEEPGARRPTVRGEHSISLATTWRLDGAARDPGAPLVLALHGMGMDEDSFALLLQKLFALPYHFLLPRGPYPMEVRGEGRIGASWYAYDGDQERFRRELQRTEGIVLDLLRAVEEGQGLRPRSRILLGFSQGGYCGSYMALRNPGLFAGMVVSGARVKTEILAREIRAAGARGFRALLCHGRRDASVAPEAAVRSRDELEAGGVSVELRMFDGGHSLGKDQVEAIRDWLRSRLDEAAAG